MREPGPRVGLFGVMAEFRSGEELVAAVRQSRRAGYQAMDAYSPFPIEGLEEVIGFRDQRVPWLALTGGLLGAAAGYFLQVYANLNYQIDVGGRPLIAWPAFMFITVELLVLFAALFSIGGMLALNHLPRLHHPVFDVERFHLASPDRFYLVIFGNDSRFDPRQTREFLGTLKPAHVDDISHTEQPE